MTKLHRIIFTMLLILGFTTSMMAQNFSNGRVQVNNRKSTESRIHHINIPLKSVLAGDMAFGWSCMNLNILTVPIPAGTPLTNLSAWTPPGGDFASSAVRGGDGNYYIVCMGPPSTLWQMDPGTGAMTKIGPITGLGSETVNGITYNQLNHTFYLAAGDYFMTNNLYSFDVHTLTATLVASFPNHAGIMIDIAINSSGVGYGYDLADDNAYTFDPITGITTLLGPLGFDCNYGQGMDIDQATGTIYLSAYNNTTYTGQLRTMNPNTGATTLVVDWGFEQISAFAINNEYVIPGPGTATDPNPAKGASNVDINEQLSWTNPAGASSINVMFGTSPSSMSSIYSGTPVTTANPGTMSYYSHYYWRVDETDESGTTYGPLWSFITTVGPNVPFNDPFDSLDKWTAVGPLGVENWAISNSNFAGGITPPELQFNWYPDFDGDSYFLSDPITLTTGHNCELTFTNYVEVWDINCGPLGVALTTDGGATFTSIYETSPLGTYGPEVETIDFIGTDGMQLAFYYTGNTISITTWAIDDVLLMDLDYTTPVELISFSGNVNDGNVILNWSTSTETNNKGFEIQRSEIGNWERIEFVDGSGTTTESREYSFIDKNVKPGNYFYRLKQIDYDGSYKFSNEVEVKVEVPVEFTLRQNYPNPFNPATTINYALPYDSHVKITVYNALGELVSILANGMEEAGNHQLRWNAVNHPSGIYFYKIEAKSADGLNVYSSVKKMILMK